MEITCLSCGRGLHEECITDPCCCPTTNVMGFSEEIKEEREDVSVSAGRKRAARDYPIEPSSDCEWQGKVNCGGGKLPITGCLSGKQKARHHGPVKRTTKNNRENIHLICASCHNRWHTLNDPVYDEELYDKLDHMPEEATAEDQAKSILFWASRKGKLTDKGTD